LAKFKINQGGSALQINILFGPGGVGLVRDATIIKDALRAAGINATITVICGFHNISFLLRWARICYVRLKVLYHQLRYQRRPFDLMLFLEQIEPEYCRLAQISCFMPNPEWITENDVNQLHQVDFILAKVRDTQRIFEARGHLVKYTSFTSFDRRWSYPGSPRQRTFFHLAGQSRQKGTATLIELWQRHPEWPLLTIVQRADRKREMPDTKHTKNIRHIGKTLDDEELKTLQNTHWFHLCPSEAEGFGHYLAEALSCGAIVLTTNAPPMNELVSSERGILVDYARTNAQNLGMNYYVSPDALEAAINELLEMSSQRLEQLSKNARAWFQDNDQQFRQNIVRAVRQIISEGATCNRG
jgi:glycosyltransferase involved in cell wall biosynthesis